MSFEEAARLNARGFALYRAGKVTEAAPAFAEVLTRRAALYSSSRFPDGHSDLARSLNNLAALHRARGDLAKAESLHARALAMFSARTSALADDEATALDPAASQPLARDGYLSCTLGLPGIDA